MTIENIIKRLKEGNQRYVEDVLNNNNQNSERRSSLIDKQEPYAIVLSCSDSRVVPELIFDTGIGELFVIRVAGNIANTSSIASIEYAVAHCNSKVIVVLGHQNCGAVIAAVNGGDNGKNLNHLLTHIQPAIEKSDSSSDVTAIIKKNAMLTAKKLIEESIIISNAIENKTVTIVPAYYNFSTGIVQFL